MRKFSFDWIAIGSTAAGVILMAFTVAWRINPVEGSVIPQFLKDNWPGQALHLLLLITCMPVWFVAAFLAAENYPAFVVGLFFLQGLAFFLIGKAVSECFRRLWRRKESWECQSKRTP